MTTTTTPTADSETEEPGRLLRLVDRALEGQHDRARARVERLRRDQPRATPEELIEQLTRGYLRRAAIGGGAIGAVAAVPAIGTIAAAALTGGQTLSFLSASAGYVLAVARIHGIEVEHPARRRTLVLAALLGKDGTRAVEGQLGLGTLAWGRAAFSRLPLGTVRSVNTTLSRRLLRAGVTRIGGLALGRLAPFGIGAVIGWTGGRAVGRRVVEGVRASFGEPPTDVA